MPFDSISIGLCMSFLFHCYHFYTNYQHNKTELTYGKTSGQSPDVPTSTTVEGKIKINETISNIETDVINIKDDIKDVILNPSFDNINKDYQRCKNNVNDINKNLEDMETILND